MNDLLTAAFSVPNFVFTILLIIVCLYWLTVILGVVGLDALDFDLDADFDVDVDVDVDVDANADVAIAVGSSSLFLGVLRFFNLGRVPFMVLLSMFILSVWSFSVYCNHPGSWINPNNSITVAALLFVPILAVSLFTTKLVTMPLVPLFKHANTFAKPMIINGKIGTLLTSIKGREKGQLKATIDESIVTLMVRSDTGAPLAKGEEVVIIEAEEDGKTYLVQRLIRH